MSWHMCHEDKQTRDIFSPQQPFLYRAFSTSQFEHTTSSTFTNKTFVIMSSTMSRNDDDLPSYHVIFSNSQQRSLTRSTNNFPSSQLSTFHRPVRFCTVLSHSPSPNSTTFKTRLSPRNTNYFLALSANASSTSRILLIRTRNATRLEKKGMRPRDIVLSVA